MVTSGGQTDIGKVISRPFQCFGVLGFIVASLGETQSSVLHIFDLVSLAMISGGQTAGVTDNDLRCGLLL